MKEKVLIIEIRENTYIGLSESGEFIERPMVNGLALGEYITIEQKQSHKKNNIIYHPLFRVAAVLILVLSIVVFSTDYTSIVMTIDINPSIELNIDQDGQVIKALALNSEASELLKKQKIKGLSYQKALEIIIEESYGQGYLKQEVENLIIVSLFSLEEIQETFQSQVEDVLHSAISKKELDVVVALHQTDEEDFLKAKDINTSVNKVIASNLASEKGIILAEEDLNNSSLVEIAKESGISPAELVSKTARFSEVYTAPPGLTKREYMPPGLSKNQDESTDVEDSQKPEKDNPSQYAPGQNKEDPKQSDEDQSEEAIDNEESKDLPNSDKVPAGQDKDDLKPEKDNPSQYAPGQNKDESDQSTEEDGEIIDNDESEDSLNSDSLESPEQNDKEGQDSKESLSDNDKEESSDNSVPLEKEDTQPSQNNDESAEKENKKEPNTNPKGKSGN